jgi:hypothetical protein
VSPELWTAQRLVRESGWRLLSSSQVRQIILDESDPPPGIGALGTVLAISPEGEVFRVGNGELLIYDGERLEER